MKKTINILLSLALVLGGFHVTGASTAQARQEDRYYVLEDFEDDTWAQFSSALIGDNAWSRISNIIPQQGNTGAIAWNGALETRTAGLVVTPDWSGQPAITQFRVYGVCGTARYEGDFDAQGPRRNEILSNWKNAYDLRFRLDNSTGQSLNLDLEMMVKEAGADIALSINQGAYLLCDGKKMAPAFVNPYGNFMMVIPAGFSGEVVVPATVSMDGSDESAGMKVSAWYLNRVPAGAEITRETIAASVYGFLLDLRATESNPSNTAEHNIFLDDFRLALTENAGVEEEEEPGRSNLDPDAKSFMAEDFQNITQNELGNLNGRVGPVTDMSYWELPSGRLVPASDNQALGLLFDWENATGNKLPVMQFEVLGLLGKGAYASDRLTRLDAMGRAKYLELDVSNPFTQPVTLHIFIDILLEDGKTTRLSFYGGSGDILLKSEGGGVNKVQFKGQHELLIPAGFTGTLSVPTKVSLDATDAQAGFTVNEYFAEALANRNQTVDIYHASNIICDVRATAMAEAGETSQPLILDNFFLRFTQRDINDEEVEEPLPPRKPVVTDGFYMLEDFEDDTWKEFARDLVGMDAWNRVSQCVPLEKENIGTVAWSQSAGEKQSAGLLLTPDWSDKAPLMQFRVHAVSGMARYAGEYDGFSRRSEIQEMWKKASDLRFYLENRTGEGVHVSFNLILDYKGKELALGINQGSYLLDENGKAHHPNFVCPYGDLLISVPAGFRGYLVIPATVSYDGTVGTAGMKLSTWYADRVSPDVQITNEDIGAGIKEFLLDVRASKKRTSNTEQNDLIFDNFKLSVNGAEYENHKTGDSFPIAAAAVFMAALPAVWLTKKRREK